MSDLAKSHRAVLDIQQAMLQDSSFREQCLAGGLPWAPERGYEPRWYNGPAPEKVRVLFLMAEPSPVGPESGQTGPPITSNLWIEPGTSLGPENYWVENFRKLCSHIWPEGTDSQMNRHVGASCTFWMSLPHGKSTTAVPAPLVAYFMREYLQPFLALFPNAVILAAGSKAHHRLAKLDVEFESCWAFTRPGCNKKGARDSWEKAGLSIRRTLRERDLVTPSKFGA